MAFDNVVFPNYPMIHGIKKSIVDPVSVVANGSREYRVKRQRWERYIWTIPTQTMTQQQKEEIKSFLVQRSHSLNSFKFVDPDASSLVNARLEMHPSFTTYYKLALPYSMNNQTVQGDHPLFNTDPHLWTYVGSSGNGIYISTQIVDGVPYVELDYSSATGYFTASGNVYFTVRLNTPLEYALVALDSNNETLGVNHSAIELIEVFGEY